MSKQEPQQIAVLPGEATKLSGKSVLAGRAPGSLPGTSKEGPKDNRAAPGDAMAKPSFAQAPPGLGKGKKRD